jgi:phage major head subunit gpT-like protein
MDITRANLNAAFTGFSTRYQAAYLAAQAWYLKLAMELPSGTRSTKQFWLAMIPKMREWLGERVAQNVANYNYELINKDYELTVEVDRNDIMDDQLGIYTPIVDMIGIQAKKHPDDVTVDLLRNGNSATLATTFDGKAFFATDHPISKSDSTSQANYGTSTALNATNYAAKRAVMMGYKGEDGRPFGVMPNLLVVPPQLEGAARTILNAEMVGDSGAGITNVWRNSAELLVVPELAVDATTWYLLDVSRPIKPLIFQRRMAPQFVKKTEITDDNVFFGKKFIMGVDSRDVGGYGTWFLASKWVG